MYKKLIFEKAEILVIIYKGELKSNIKKVSSDFQQLMNKFMQPFS